jgi:hypothetical protein
MRFLPGIFSSLRRRAARAPQCIVNPIGLATLPRVGDTLGREKGRRGLRPFAF